MVNLMLLKCIICSNEVKLNLKGISKINVQKKKLFEFIAKLDIKSTSAHKDSDVGHKNVFC